MYKKKIKCEIYRDSMQNYKKYAIPPAQLIIADVPYNVGNNFYGSNPMWYNGGDNKNGESKLAKKAAFNSDFNFNLYEYFHFCSKMLKKEDTKPIARGRSSNSPCMIVFCSFEQLSTLIAADYGAPTTRKRWYAIFRKDGKPISWPVQTHSKVGGHLPKWKECGDYIDWSDLGKSIFDRKKPLAEATMNRIGNGLKKYVFNSEKPYFVESKDAFSFLIQYHGEQKAGDARGQLLTEPIKTIDTSNRYGLISAFVTKFYKTGVGQGLNEPLHTITTSPGHFGLVCAFLIKYYGGGPGQTIDRPLDTITTKDRFGLVSVSINGEKYIINDIFLRMLKPSELKIMQGFPEDYIIDRDIDWKPYPLKEQVARIGNSVVPVMAQALVKANCSYLAVGERTKNIVIDTSEKQLRIAI